MRRTTGRGLLGFQKRQAHCRNLANSVNSQPARNTKKTTSLARRPGRPQGGQGRLDCDRRPGSLRELSEHFMAEISLHEPFPTSQVPQWEEGAYFSMRAPRREWREAPSALRADESRGEPGPGKRTRQRIGEAPRGRHSRPPSTRTRRACTDYTCRGAKHGRFLSRAEPMNWLPWLWLADGLAPLVLLLALR